MKALLKTIFAVYVGFGVIVSIGLGLLGVIACTTLWLFGAAFYIVPCVILVAKLVVAAVLIGGTWVLLIKYTDWLSWLFNK